MSTEQHQAEMYALANDDNLATLLAWRLVKQRAEGGGFNGLLASDLTNARAALAAMLDNAHCVARQEADQREESLARASAFDQYARWIEHDNAR